MVGFKPWGLSSFFDFNLSELIDDNLNLHDICPIEMRRIEDQIRTKTTDEARIEVIENFLLSLLKPDARDPLIEHAVHEILAQKGMVSVSEMAKAFHLSQKQFTRRFVRTVGAPPKLYAKLARFQHVLTMINDRKAKLTELAYQAGYFDQSHFIKEIRDFTTETPTSLKHKSLQSELGKFFREQSKKSIFYNSAYL
jgi:AraC-like DNA-binding protein